MSTRAPEVDTLTKEWIDAVTPASSRRLRSAAVAVLSAAVLAAAALFVAVPAESSVAFSVRETGVAGTGAVVYGKIVDRHGEPIANARVRMVRWVDGERHVVRRKRTDENGLFRFRFQHPKRDTYNVRVVERRNGHTFVGWHGIEMRPGRAYDVSAQLTRHRSFLFLPVSTY